MSVEIPKHLQPKKADDGVEVPVDATVKKHVSAEHLDELQKRLGMARVNGTQLRALADFGMAAKDLGILEVIKGSTLVSQDSLTRTIIKLDGIINDTDGKYKHEEQMAAAKIQGYLIEKLSKLNLSSVKVDQTVTEVVMQRDRFNRQAAAPGMKVAKASQS